MPVPQRQPRAAPFRRKDQRVGVDDPLGEQAAHEAPQRVVPGGGESLFMPSDIERMIGLQKRERRLHGFDPIRFQAACRCGQVAGK
jgi:hypothetical protein